MKPDSLLILGVSGCLFLPIFRLFSKSKVITNIDGLEWKRAKWNKFIKRFLKFSEKIAVHFSDIVVTDNQAITNYVRAEYGVEGKNIAYGGDHALSNIGSDEEILETYALGLCRIEPENNVELILESFRASEQPLKFVGNWNASDFGRKLKSKYIDVANIELLDPIYDLNKLYMIRRNCSLYLHGHSAGGTNPSLVEMMHFGVPIFAFDCSFNRFSTEGKASYFADTKGLLAMLKYQNSDSLKKNAINMNEIARRRYIWKEITHQYENLYR